MLPRLLLANNNARQFVFITLCSDASEAFHSKTAARLLSTVGSPIGAHGSTEAGDEARGGELDPAADCATMPSVHSTPFETEASELICPELALFRTRTSYPLASSRSCATASSPARWPVQKQREFRARCSAVTTATSCSSKRNRRSVPAMLSSEYTAAPAANQTRPSSSETLIASTGSEHPGI